MEKYVDFDSPPLNEVVVGLQFAEASESLSPLHIGLFWDEIREDYPSISEANPIASVVETDTSTKNQPIEFSFGANSPYRFWMITENGSQLLQFQRDRFLLNWKKIENGGSYPDFRLVFEEFATRFDQFSAFAKRQKVELPEQNQFELTYVNYIPVDPEKGENPHTDYFVDHIFSSSHDFLEPPEMFNWSWNYAFQMPDKLGRLHIKASPFTLPSNGQLVTRMDLTARGFHPDGMNAWFALGHEWVTKAFADVTSKSLHEKWERKL